MKRRFTILTAAFALLTFLAFPMGMMAQTSASITFSEQGYSNQQEISTVEFDGVTASFDKGTNSNAPKYYTSGTAIRCYGGNTMTITANNESITAITITFGSSDGSNAITSNVGTYENGSWTGSTTSVTFTIGGTSGNRRFAGLSVTYGGDTPTPTTYIVTFDAGDGTFVGNTNFPNASNTVAAGTYTLPSATPAEGYVFNGWALGENTYEGGANYTVSGDVNFTASYTENTTPSGDEQWVLTNLADLTASDVFVIVGNNGSNYAMTNNNGTSNAPAASAVIVENSMITSTVAENIQWTISGNSTDGYTFYPNGSTSTWLYCTNSNNGVRVGTNTNNAFVVDGGYLKNSATSRYIGIYNSQDWRCYTSTDGNIANQTFAFFKKVTGGVVPPSISANNVEIAYDATSGSFEFTVNNPIEGGVTTVTEDVDWISDAVVSDNTVNFSTSANEANTARTATITLTYTYGDNETVTKDVTITQAAAPVIYTTIPTLFEAATSTETSVLVTFNNWVVSGVSTNGKNVFVTDNSGNGFVIYSNEDMSSIYAAGSILSGTAVSCSLKKYNGFAELLNVNATDLTIATGGNVTEANVAMADLAGVNTGALVHYENLTCSVNNNKYYLTDGTTTIQVYNSLFAFDALEDGETYNITGIYQQYNNTKEILPRSAADIEEVEVPHSEYTLTVEPFENLELITFVNDEMVMEGDGEIQVNEGDQIMLSIVAAEGYVMQTLMVNGVNHVNDIADDFTYSFEMPAEIVTISATAVEDVPPTLGAWVLTDLADLTADDVFVIVGDNGDTYAMSNDKGTSAAPVAVAVTVVEGRLSAEPASNLQWNISISEDGYTFYPNGETETWLYCTNTNNGVRVGTNINKVFVLDNESGYLKNVATSRYIGIYNSQDWRCYTSINSNIEGQSFAFYKKVAEPATETYTLDITGYEAGSNGGYYLIASPVTVDPEEVEGMTTDDFDLYYFDEAEDNEWRNYEAHPFNLVPGKGYLYAKQATTEGEIFHFELTGTPYDGDGTIELNYTEGGDFPGWNLVGNPYNEEAGLNLPFYRMNTEGTELEPVSQGTVNPMEGVFVIAQTDPETGDIINAQFTAGMGSNSGDEKLVLNVSRNRGNVVDRAIVRFGQGGVLPKFQLNENSTKLYIVEGENEYAVVRSANEGEMPVSFKASENGSYTLSVNAENVKMEYLHLIDNMTGTDVDLLATPSYSFEARTNDYESRFRLVFSGNTNVGSSTSSETFAFFNGNSWVINNEGEATLQVIDMMGRVLSNEQINGSYNNSLNLSAGVYVLRLSNGNTVKTQKVVVD